jgi:hypothetical protein
MVDTVTGGRNARAAGRPSLRNLPTLASSGRQRPRGRNRQIGACVSQHPRRLPPFATGCPNLDSLIDQGSQPPRCRLPFATPPPHRTRRSPSVRPPPSASLAALRYIGGIKRMPTKNGPGDRPRRTIPWSQVRFALGSPLEGRRRHGRTPLQRSPEQSGHQSALSCA